MPTRSHAPDRRLLPAALCCAALLCELLSLSSCSKGDNSASITPGENGADDPALVIPAQTITPASLAVHPLTRIGADSSGKPAVLLYLDVKDKFGQSIKALGRVRAELYKPASSATTSDTLDADTASRIQSQDRIWNLDLRDPDRNAISFDNLVTRTYTIPLGGLPDWILEWSRGIGNDAPTIRVEFTFTDKQGGETTLRAAQRLSR